MRLDSEREGYTGKRSFRRDKPVERLAEAIYRLEKKIKLNQGVWSTLRIVSRETGEGDAL